MTQARARSRRDFLSVLATTTVGLPLLAACGQLAPAAPAKPTAAAAAAKPGSLYPSFIAYTNPAKPDFPSPGPLYQDGYSTYPKNPQKALPPTPPGNNSK